VWFRSARTERLTLNRAFRSKQDWQVLRVRFHSWAAAKDISILHMHDLSDP
jgi:hypothetical protein